MSLSNSDRRCLFYRSGLQVLVGLSLFFLSGFASKAVAYTELSDAQLDGVTAGTAAIGIEDEWIRFEFLSARNRGRSVDASGTLSFRKEDLSLSLGQLIIQDSAQSNLSALININAVNSPVQVLLNLNINVNSSVGTIRQINLSGQLPSALE